MDFVEWFMIWTWDGFLDWRMSGELEGCSEKLREFQVLPFIDDWHFLP